MWKPPERCHREQSIVPIQFLPPQVWETRKRGCSFSRQFYFFRLTSPFPPPPSFCPCFPPAKRPLCLFWSPGVPERSEVPDRLLLRVRKLPMCSRDSVTWVDLQRSFWTPRACPFHLTSNQKNRQWPCRKKFQPNNSAPAGKCTVSKPGENTTLFPNSCFLEVGEMIHPFENKNKKYLDSSASFTWAPNFYLPEVCESI